MLSLHEIQKQMKILFEVAGLPMYSEILEYRGKNKMLDYNERTVAVKVGLFVHEMKNFLQACAAVENYLVVSGFYQLKACPDKEKIKRIVNQACLTTQKLGFGGVLIRAQVIYQARQMGAEYDTYVADWAEEGLFSSMEISAMFQAMIQDLHDMSAKCETIFPKDQSDDIAISNLNLPETLLTFKNYWVKIEKAERDDKIFRANPFTVRSEDDKIRSAERGMEIDLVRDIRNTLYQAVNNGNAIGFLERYFSSVAAREIMERRKDKISVKMAKQIIKVFNDDKHAFFLYLWKGKDDCLY